MYSRQITKKGRCTTTLSINVESYNKIKLLALKLTGERLETVRASDLLDEAMEYIINKYNV